MRFTPDGGVRADNIPARVLITIAYELQPYQLVNAPGWASETRYDIDAKPAAASRGTDLRDAPGAPGRAVRTSFHREMRAVDGFALLRVHPDRLGPQLGVSELDCQAAFLATPRCRQGGIRIDQITADRHSDVRSCCRLVDLTR